MEYCLEIDTNNSLLIQKLLYYLQNTIKDTKYVSNEIFILESTLKICGRNEFLFLPKGEFAFLYDEKEIIMNYAKTRESLNYNYAEIRFDLITLKVKMEYGMEYLHNFLNFIIKLELKKYDDELVKYTWKDSYWHYNKAFKKRKIDTIYLPNKEKKHIVDSIDNFLHDKNTIQLYDNLDIPHKKIFLFYGIPGSGKTSFIRALASHFKFNVCLVKNVVELDDEGLEEMLNVLPKNSFLIFEDIDCIFNKRETKDFKSNISFSGLLNVLDGIGNYKNLLVFITTNYIDNLDDALKRRVDIFMEFTHIKKEEIIEMYNNFFPTCDKYDEFYNLIQNIKTTPNAIEKFFINCLQLNITPSDNIKYLKHYTEMTTDILSQRTQYNLYN